MPVGLYIASKIKRPKAPITLGNGPGKAASIYYFKPVDPDNPHSEHVAFVANPAHIQRFLSITEGYHVSEADIPEGNIPKPEPTVVAPPVSASIKPPEAVIPESVPPSDPLGTAGLPNLTGDTLEGPELPGDTLLALPLKEFKKAIVSADRESLRAALATEKSKPAADERPTYVKALEERLAKPE